jgi:hypothetical protein
MPERPRPDIEQVRRALREHDEAREDEETPAEGGGEEPAPRDEPADDD